MKQIKTIIPLSLFKQKTKEYLSLMEVVYEVIMLTVHGISDEAKCLGDHDWRKNSGLIT